MKPLKLLLLLCLMTCVDGWAQAIYYVTKEGAGNHSGESWQNALDETGFSDKFTSSPSSQENGKDIRGQTGYHG